MLGVAKLHGWLGIATMVVPPHDSLSPQITTVHGGFKDCTLHTSCCICHELSNALFKSARGHVSAKL